MQALVYRGKGKLRFEARPKPSIKPDEVLLKNRAVGVCGTDLHIYHGGVAGVKPGTIIGHEFAGTIAAVGRQVKDLTKGDHVVAEHNVSCKVCYYCRRGKYNL